MHKDSRKLLGFIVALILLFGLINLGIVRGTRKIKVTEVEIETPEEETIFIEGEREVDEAKEARKALDSSSEESEVEDKKTEETPEEGKEEEEEKVEVGKQEEKKEEGEPTEKIEEKTPEQMETTEVTTEEVVDDAEIAEVEILDPDKVLQLRKELDTYTSKALNINKGILKKIFGKKLKPKKKMETEEEMEEIEAPVVDSDYKKFSEEEYLNMEPSEIQKLVTVKHDEWIKLFSQLSEEDKRVKSANKTLDVANVSGSVNSVIEIGYRAALVEAEKARDETKRTMCEYYMKNLHPFLSQFLHLDEKTKRIEKVDNKFIENTYTLMINYKQIVDSMNPSDPDYENSKETYEVYNFILPIIQKFYDFHSLAKEILFKKDTEVITAHQIESIVAEFNNVSNKVAQYIEHYNFPRVMRAVHELIHDETCQILSDKLKALKEAADHFEKNNSLFQIYSDAASINFRAERKRIGAIMKELTIAEEDLETELGIKNLDKLKPGKLTRAFLYKGFDSYDVDQDQVEKGIADKEFPEELKQDKKYFFHKGFKVVKNLFKAKKVNVDATDEDSLEKDGETVVEKNFGFVPGRLEELKSMKIIPSEDAFRIKKSKLLNLIKECKSRLEKEIVMLNNLEVLCPNFMNLIDVCISYSVVKDPQRQFENFEKQKIPQKYIEDAFYGAQDIEVAYQEMCHYREFAGYYLQVYREQQKCDELKSDLLSKIGTNMLSTNTVKNILKGNIDKIVDIDDIQKNVTPELIKISLNSSFMMTDNDKRLIQKGKEFAKAREELCNQIIAMRTTENQMLAVINKERQQEAKKKKTKIYKLYQNDPKTEIKLPKHMMESYKEKVDNFHKKRGEYDALMVLSLKDTSYTNLSQAIRRVEADLCQEARDEAHFYCVTKVNQFNYDEVYRPRPNPKIEKQSQENFKAIRKTMLRHTQYLIRCLRDVGILNLNK